MLLQKKILTPISHKLEAACCGYSSPDASLSNYLSNASLYNTISLSCHQQVSLSGL